MLHRSHDWVLWPLVLMLIIGCITSDPTVETPADSNPDATSADAASAAPPDRLEASDLGSTPNVHSFGSVILAGQPDADDLEIAKQRGVEVVVSLREDGEVNWDQAGRLEELGLEFQQVGFRSIDSLTDDVFDQVRQVLRESDERPVLLHCGSANRVGAVWLAHRVLDHGIEVEEATAEAKEVGLKNAEYETKALDYVERNR